MKEFMFMKIRGSQNVNSFPICNKIIWNQDKGSLYWLLINEKM